MAAQALFSTVLLSTFGGAAVAQAVEAGSGAESSFEATPAAGSVQTLANDRMARNTSKARHLGLNIGSSSVLRCGIGLSCQKNGTAVKVYTDASLDSWWDVQFGYTDLGRMERNNALVRARGLSLSLLGQVPLGKNTQAFARVGGLYGKTQAAATVGMGSLDGTTHGFGSTYGVGVGMKLGKSWDVRVERDRYRFELANGELNVATTTLGLRYRY